MDIPFIDRVRLEQAARDFVHSHRLLGGTGVGDRSSRTEFFRTPRHQPIVPDGLAPILRVEPFVG